MQSDLPASASPAVDKLTVGPAAPASDVRRVVLVRPWNGSGAACVDD